MIEEAVRCVLKSKPRTLNAVVDDGNDGWDSEGEHRGGRRGKDEEAELQEEDMFIFVELNCNLVYLYNFKCADLF